MEKNQYFSIPELAGFLGISRIAVYRKVKRGEIKAIRIGRNYAIPKKYSVGHLDGELTEEQKRKISGAVKKTIAEYGEVLKLLGRE